jgi:hypothetical protein
VRELTTVASRNVSVQGVPGCSVQLVDLKRLATEPWCRTCQAHMRVFSICAWTAGADVGRPGIVIGQGRGKQRCAKERERLQKAN